MPGSIQTWAIGVLAALVLILGGTIYGQHQHAVALEAQVKSLTTQRDDADKANKNLADANGKYETATKQLADDLDACVGKKQAVDAILASTQATLAKVTKQRNAAMKQLNDTKEKLYAADPACASWGALPVCGGLSDGLRQQWQQAQHVGDGNSADSGSGSAPAAHADPGQHDGAAGAAGPPAPGHLR